MWLVFQERGVYSSYTYIALGSIALKYGQTLRVRALSFGLALLSFLYIVLVAIARNAGRSLALKIEQHRVYAFSMAGIESRARCHTGVIKVIIASFPHPQGEAMRTRISILAVLFITFAPPAIQAGDTDEAAAKDGPGRNYNLGGPKPVEDETVSAKPIVVDSKKFNLTPEAFQKMAIKALLKYNWKIETNELTRVQGSYIKNDNYSGMTTKTYKVELRYTGDTIVIGFVPGFHHPRNGWLRNLEKQVKIEAQALRREAEAQRYLNK